MHESSLTFKDALKVLLAYLILMNEAWAERKKTLIAIGKQAILSPLPRSEHEEQEERIALELFAKQQGMMLKWIYPTSVKAAKALLVSGKADVMLSSWSKELMDYKYLSKSIPLHSSPYLLVGNHRSLKLEEAVSTTPSLLYREGRHEERELVAALLSAFPSVQANAVSSSVKGDALYNWLADAKADYIIVPESDFNSDRYYRNDIKQVRRFSISFDRHWLVSATNSRLLDDVNAFLLKLKAGLFDKSIVKVGLVNGHQGMFLYHGQKKGFHYKLIDDFFKTTPFSYRIVLAENKFQLQTLLAEKQIDLAADFFTAGEVESFHAELGPKLIEAQPVLAYRASQAPLRSKVRFLTIPVNAYFHQQPLDLSKTHEDVQILELKQPLNSETLFSRLGGGVYDLIYAFEHEVHREQQFAAWPLTYEKVGFGVPVSWQLSKKVSFLTPRLETFFSKQVIHDRYDQYFRGYNLPETLNSQPKTFKVYDELVKSSAYHSPLSTTLSLALMNVTSGAASHFTLGSGAYGLFGMHSVPAQVLGFADYKLPRNNMMAAFDYLNWMALALSNYNVKADQLPWFLLAAYHSGLDHLEDAFHLARKLKLNDRVWFGGVEKAMSFLEHPRYFSFSRYGYHKGSQTVLFVQRVLNENNSLRKVWTGKSLVAKLIWIGHQKKKLHLRESQKTLTLKQSRDKGLKHVAVHLVIWANRRFFQD